MSIVEEIEIIYFKIEDEYYHQEFDARFAANYLEEDKLIRKRELNMHAYFLFLFTRLENHIFSVSSEIIKEKIDSMTDPKEKIIWDISSTKKIHFLKRVKLLTEVNNLDYYETI